MASTKIGQVSIFFWRREPFTACLASFRSGEEGPRYRRKAQGTEALPTKNRRHSPPSRRVAYVPTMSLAGSSLMWLEPDICRASNFPIFPHLLWLIEMYRYMSPNIIPRVFHPLTPNNQRPITGGPATKIFLTLALLTTLSY